MIWPRDPSTDEEFAEEIRSGPPAPPQRIVNDVERRNYKLQAIIALLVVALTASVGVNLLLAARLLDSNQ